MMARHGRGENVSAPFLRVLIICECTDPILHTHSPSKRRAIRGRLLVVLEDLSIYDGLLRLWVER